MLKWLITSTTRFGEFTREWDALVQRNGYPPFMQSRFVGPACELFLEGKHRFVLATDEDKPVAAGILVQLDTWRWSSFQPSQLPMGAWLTAREQPLDDLLAALGRSLPGVPVMLSITQQDPLAVVRPERSPRLDTIDYIATACVDIGGSFEEFWEARGKNLKQNLRKQRRKIEGEGRKLTFEAATTKDRVAAMLIDFGALESRGWKSKDGTAIAPDNAQGRFYARVLESFAETNEAFCCALKLDGAPIAVDLCIRDAESMVILKTTYDETMKALSPGQLLHLDTFRQLFSLPGLKRVEFFGRVMEWHTRWTEQSRTLYHANFYRWPWLQTLHRLRRSRIRRNAGDAASVMKSRSDLP